jgi:hypothetical protein
VGRTVQDTWGLTSGTASIPALFYHTTDSVRVESTPKNLKISPVRLKLVLDIKNFMLE